MNAHINIQEYVLIFIITHINIQEYVLIFIITHINIQEYVLIFIITSSVNIQNNYIYSLLLTVVCGGFLVAGIYFPPCTAALLKYSTDPTSGTYYPRCTPTGEFEKMHCHGSLCYCVDRNGNQIKGTTVPVWETPKCPGKDLIASANATVTYQPGARCNSILEFSLMVQ